MLFGWMLLSVGVVAVVKQSFDVCHKGASDAWRIGCIICAMLNGVMIVSGVALIRGLVVLPNG